MNKLVLPILAFSIIACSGTPRIKFDNTHHDFGLQNARTELSHTFSFSNLGDGTLRIKDIHAG